MNIPAKPETLDCLLDTEVNVNSQGNIAPTRVSKRQGQITETLLVKIIPNQKHNTHKYDCILKGGTVQR